MRVVCAGAAGGIGRRVTTQLLAAGHSVVALDRDESGLAALRESVVNADAETSADADALETTVVDLTDERAATDAVEGIDADAIVSCVGWYALGALEDCSPARLREHLEMNLVAVHAVVRPLLATLRRRSGRVVLVGSMAGSVPLPFHGGYGAAKAGIAAYATTLRREVGAHGVDVVLVEPGPTRTGFNERAAAALSDEETARSADDAHDGSAYADAYRAFGSYAPESVRPGRVAERVVTATTTDRPRTRYRVGARARWLPRLGALLPTRLFDRIVRAGMPDGRLGRWIDRRQ